MAIGDDPLITNSQFPAPNTQCCWPSRVQPFPVGTNQSLPMLRSSNLIITSNLHTHFINSKVTSLPYIALPDPLTSASSWGRSLVLQKCKCAGWIIKVRGCVVTGIGRERAGQICCKLAPTMYGPTDARWPDGTPKKMKTVIMVGGSMLSHSSLCNFYVFLIGILYFIFYIFLYPFGWGETKGRYWLVLGGLENKAFELYKCIFGSCNCCFDYF